MPDKFQKVNTNNKINTLNKPNSDNISDLRKEIMAYNGAVELWDNSLSADPNHPYLLKKQIKPYLLKKCDKFNNWQDNWLLVPISSFASLKLQSLQAISLDRKFCYTDCPIKGGAYIFGDLEKHNDKAYICEGWATGATIHEITGLPVVVAFNCGNLKEIAKIGINKYPDIEFIIAADNDSGNKKNSGLNKAKEISKELNIGYIYPTFKKGDKGNDFNDLKRLYGKNEGLVQINNINYEIETTAEAVDRIELLTNDEKGNVKKRTQDAILEDIGKCCKFIIDQNEQIYSVIQENKARKIYLLTGEDYYDWLNRQFHKKTGEGAILLKLKKALTILRGLAKDEAKQITMFLRFGYHANKKYIDLYNKNWEVLEISKDGCKILNNAPVYFYRTPQMQKMEVDLTAEFKDFLNLFELINVPKNTQSLILGWLLSSIKGQGPYGVLNIHGSADSGKTTTTVALRNLIDPNTAPIREAPIGVRNLIAMIKNNALLAIDNSGIIDPDLSNKLARMTISSGGAGLSCRKLYTDDDQKTYNRQAPVIINSICNAIITPDLQNRCLDISPESFDKTNYKNILSENDWRTKFKKEAPKIRGALFKMIAKGLNSDYKCELNDKGRHREMVAFATKIEYETGIFPIETFFNQYKIMKKESISNLVLSNSLTIYINFRLESVKSFQESAVFFHSQYNNWLNNRNERGITSTGLGMRLSAHKKNLLEFGIDFISIKTAKGKEYKFIQINNDSFIK